MAVKLQAGPRLDSARQKIPQNPGVYFFKNSRGKTLYIGKAGNLRLRLGSYLRIQKKITYPLSPSLILREGAGGGSRKLISLLQEADKIEWEILNSEVEALIKEAELIKKYRPKYNVLMRDDKHYFYVGFSRDIFPKLFITHQPHNNFDYIGPFTEGGAIRSVLKTLRRTFTYCTCKSLHAKLCLNGKIGRCHGYCCLKSQRQERVSEYQKNISAIKKILSGKNQKLARELKKEMTALSKAKKYEEAGKARDRIMALERIFLHRGVIKQDLPSESLKALRALESILNIEKITRIEAYDIANIGGKFAYGSMAVLSARGGSALGEEGFILKKEDYRIFKINGVQGSNDPAMLREVLSRRFRHPEWTYPQVIIVDGGKPQLSAVLHAQKLAFKNRLTLPRNESELNSAARAHTYDFSLQVSEPPKIIALTKNKKHAGDHIFMSGRGNPMPLDRLPPPLKNLILNLDSEAHRFAISHYRRFHRKSLTTPCKKAD